MGTVVHNFENDSHSVHQVLHPEGNTNFWSTFHHIQRLLRHFSIPAVSPDCWAALIGRGQQLIGRYSVALCLPSSHHMEIFDMFSALFYTSDKIQPDRNVRSLLELNTTFCEFEDEACSADLRDQNSPHPLPCRSPAAPAYLLTFHAAHQNTQTRLSGRKPRKRTPPPLLRMIWIVTSRCLHEQPCQLFCRHVIQQLGRLTNCCWNFPTVTETSQWCQLVSRLL